MERALLAVDGGNTKTIAVLVGEEGVLLAHARTGSSNWQTLGEEGARRALGEVLGPLMAEADRQGRRIGAAALGLTGCDRPRDQEVLRGIVGGLLPRGPGGADHPEAPFVVLNDAFLVLRAGTADDVGVAVSSGTGGNCVARGPDGRRLQVGGLTTELGDGGGAGDIALRGLQAVGLARDGRGWQTVLTDLLLEVAGLERVEDLMDFAIPGPGGRDPAEDLPRIADLAPLVFEAARQGDPVCRRILEDVGQSLGRQAIIAAHHFFRREDAFPLVLGGSVIRRGVVEDLSRAVVLETRTFFPNVRPVMLSHEPILGAVLLARDLLDPPVPWAADLVESLGRDLDALL